MFLYAANIGTIDVHLTLYYGLNELLDVLTTNMVVMVTLPVNFDDIVEFSRLVLRLSIARNRIRTTPNVPSVTEVQSLTYSRRGECDNIFIFESLPQRLFPSAATAIFSRTSYVQVDVVLGIFYDIHRKIRD